MKMAKGWYRCRYVGNAKDGSVYVDYGTEFIKDHDDYLKKSKRTEHGFEARGYTKVKLEYTKDTSPWY